MTVNLCRMANSHLILYFIAFISDYKSEHSATLSSNAAREINMSKVKAVLFLQPMYFFHRLSEARFVTFQCGGAVGKVLPYMTME